MKRNMTNKPAVRLVLLFLILTMMMTAILAGTAFAQKAEEEGLVAECSAQRAMGTDYDIDFSAMNSNGIDPVTGQKALPATVYPDQKPFWVYKDYFDFSPILLTTVFYRNMVDYFYLEVSDDGWKTFTRFNNYSGVPFSYSNSTNTIRKLKNTKLKPDRKYWIRLRQTDKYGSYKNGKIFYKTTVRTGKKSIKVKSISMKAIKVKRHSKKTIVYGYFTWWSYRTYWYTYKVQVTVKLKKKPGTPGVLINNEWVKGNKKTYKITFPRKGYYVWNSKKSPVRRAKFRVMVYSAYSKEYGGCSPYKSKRKKVS